MKIHKWIEKPFGKFDVDEILNNFQYSLIPPTQIKVRDDKVCLYLLDERKGVINFSILKISDVLKLFSFEKF